MVQRAQQLQQKEQEHPVAAALAAAAAAAAAADAPSSRRRAGARGAKGEAAAAGVGRPDSGQDVAEGVEQQVRQMMLEAGASLQQLKELNTALGASGQ
jgi:hypothetical protein